MSDDMDNVGAWMREYKLVTSVLEEIGEQNRELGDRLEAGRTFCGNRGFAGPRQMRTGGR